MLINEITFSEIKKDLISNDVSIQNYLASEMGKVYVISITRQGCRACEKQKPKLKKLAKTTEDKYGAQVVFHQIHINYSPEHPEESLKSKDLFGHYFYPTIMILLKTVDRGAIDYYRNVSPNMHELKNNIEVALEIAKAIGNA